MLVVADTSPINYLVLIQHEAILPALYERVSSLRPSWRICGKHARQQRYAHGGYIPQNGLRSASLN